MNVNRRQFACRADKNHSGGCAPNEIGLLIEAIAPTQEIADNIVSLARSTALHQPFPGRKATAGNLAFPFSPSDLRCGAVYEFTLNHLLEIDEMAGYFMTATTTVV